MSTSLYLEHYLDSLDSLPGDLRRNFTLMYDLDMKNKTILRDVDSASDEYLRKVRELSPAKRKDEMEKIQKMFKKAKEHGDDKVSIAIQTYEMVDKHIRRLDSDLAKFEAEMREKGRLSQSETEEDEGEEEEDTKKKGRKKSNAGARGDTGKKRGGGKKDGATNGGADDDKKKNKKTKAGKKSDVQVKDISPLLPVPQEVLDMPVDPNEPTYCICQQVSYGEMIGCDNSDCPIEWFHFGCIGLTAKPKGKWYCTKCMPMFKKKK